MDLSLGLRPDYWVPAALVSTRVVGLLISAPFFDVGAIPIRVRGALALLIGLIVLPSTASAIEVASLPSLSLAVVGELLVGVVMGLTVTLFFAGVSMAGEVAGVQMGLGAATALDPTNNVTMPVVANLLYMVALAVWFAVGGHLILIRALYESYQLVPPGGLSIGETGLIDYSIGLRITLEAAVRIAAPALVALLLANAAMAVLGRTAPQMNVFIAAFPVTIGLGLVVLALTMASFGSLVSRWSLNSYEVIGNALRMLIGG